MSYDDQDMASAEQTAAVKSKLTVPAVLLIVTGILNVLAGGYLALNGVVILAMPQQAMQGMDPQQRQDLEKMGMTPESVIKYTGVGCLVLGVVSVIAALVTTVGGIMMLTLKARGLAMTGSILAAIPCISPTVCCALGLVAGIYGAVVLSAADVKAAFR